MQIKKYDIDFVKKIGSQYTSQLNPELIKKFKILKKKFYNEDSTVVNLKKNQEWRNEVSDASKIIKKDTIKEIYLHLNKLSDSNIDTISFQINDLIENEKDDTVKNTLVEKLVDRLFQNAKIQIHFCHLYAFLFSKLIHKNKKLYFDKINNKIKLQFKQIEEMKNADENGDYNNYCDNMQIKDNYIGCYQFCVELYCYDVLTIVNITQIINNIIEDLVKQKEIYRIEIIVESICRIMSTLTKSKRIDPINLKKLVDIIKIGYTNNKKTLNPRSRFIYEDAINVKI